MKKYSYLSFSALSLLIMSSPVLAGMKIVPYFTEGAAPSVSSSFMPGPKCNPADSVGHDNNLCISGSDIAGLKGTDCSKLTNSQLETTQTGSVCSGFLKLGTIIKNDVVINMEVSGLINAGTAFGREYPQMVAIASSSLDGNAYNIIRGSIINSQNPNGPVNVVSHLPTYEQLNLILPSSFSLGQDWKPQTIHLTKPQAKVLLAPPGLMSKAIPIPSEGDSASTLKDTDGIKTHPDIDAVFVAATDINEVPAGCAASNSCITVTDFNPRDGIGQNLTYKQYEQVDGTNFLPQAIDMTGIVMHEMLHALGVTSYVDVIGDDPSFMEQFTPETQGLPLIDLFGLEENNLVNITSNEAFNMANRYLDRVVLPEDITNYFFDLLFNQGVLFAPLNPEDGNHVFVYGLKDNNAQYIEMSGGGFLKFGRPLVGDWLQHAHVRSPFFMEFIPDGTYLYRRFEWLPGKRGADDEVPVISLIAPALLPHYVYRPTRDDLILLDALGYGVDYTTLSPKGTVEW